MLLHILNWAGVIVAGAAWRRKERHVPLIVIGVVAAANVLLLQRVELSAAISFLDRRFTVLELLPYPLLFAFLLMRRLTKWGLQLLAYVALVLAMAIIAFLIKGVNLGWAVYSVVIFVGPMLHGVCVSTLDLRQARLLLRRLELLITVLAALSVGAVLAAAPFALSMGWTRAPERLVSPVGSAIGTGSVALLLFPKALNDALRASSRKALMVLGVLTLCLLFSGSRAIAAAAAFTAIFVTARVFLNSSSMTSILKAGLLSLIVCAGLGFTIRNLHESRAVNRLGTTVGSLEGDRLRIMSARAAISQIGKDPIVGSVPGHTYPWFMTDYTSTGAKVTTVAGQISLVEPHNLFLFLAVEYGVLPAAILLVIIISAVIALYRSGVEDLAMYAVGVVAYLAQTVGNTSLAIHPRIGAIFWLLLSSAMVIASYYRSHSRAAARTLRGVRPLFAIAGGGSTR